MRDYSKFHGIDNNEKIKRDGMKVLEANLNGFESYPVEVNGVANRLMIWNKYSSRMGDSRDTKTAVGKYGDFKIGDIIKHDERLWMVITYPETNKISQEAVIQICNHILKWQRNNIIHSYPTVVFSRTAYKDDVYPDKVMTLASGQYQLYIARDENSLNLKIDDRFFIGRDIYEIAYIDDVTLDGILIFTLNKGQFNAAKDNAELGIADYVEVTEDEIQAPPANNGGGLW